MGVRKRTIPLKKAAYRSGYEKKVANLLKEGGFKENE
jgi:hypothetical protein